MIQSLVGCASDTGEELVQKALAFLLPAFIIAMKYEFPIARVVILPFIVNGLCFTCSIVLAGNVESGLA